MIGQRLIRHEHRGHTLESVLMLPDGTSPFPSILLIHEFTGLNTATLDQAVFLAKNGFAVLAADFYGTGERPKNRAQARIVHHKYRDDRPLMRSRAAACLNALASCPETDLNRLFALGFSFGGAAVLELARSGVPLRKTVSVYGYLDTPEPATWLDIPGRILAFHVTDDTVVPEEQSERFTEEMNAAEADWQLRRVADAAHGFANPDSDTFDESLTTTIWTEILEFLNED